MTSDGAAVPTEFPVTWRFPEDPQWLWSHDRLHYPDAVTPLEFSLIEGGVDAGVTRAARAYHVPISVHDRHVNSYLYVSVQSHDLSGADAEVAQMSAARLHEAMANLRPLWDSTWLPEIQEHLAWWSWVDLADASLPALLRHLLEAERRWSRLWEIHFLLFIPSMLAVSQFADLYRDVLQQADPLAPFRLLTGLGGKTMEAGEDLWDLSRLIIADPVLLGIFGRAAAADVVQCLTESVAGQTFMVEFDRYLSVHGYRGDKLSLHHSYWIEDPTPVIRNLQHYIDQPGRDLRGELQEASHGRERAVADLYAALEACPEPAREQVGLFLDAAQAGVFLKEEHGYWIDCKASYCMRQTLMAIGRHLVEGGVLIDEDDMFYLTLDELKDVLAADNPVGWVSANYRPLVASRRDQAERFSGVMPPLELGRPQDRPSDRNDIADWIKQMFEKVEGELDLEVKLREPTGGFTQILGIPGAPGVAQGPVKVMRSLEDAAKLEPGDILVAQTTAPPWSLLFASVAALVTNSGGILSHSAVLAREFGIPAVVGTSVATQRLLDGQHVEVDGNRGTVRIL